MLAAVQQDADSTVRTTNGEILSKVVRKTLQDRSEPLSRAIKAYATGPLPFYDTDVKLGRASLAADITKTLHDILPRDVLQVPGTSKHCAARVQDILARWAHELFEDGTGLVEILAGFIGSREDKSKWESFREILDSRIKSAKFEHPRSPSLGHVSKNDEHLVLMRRMLEHEATDSAS
ncbi:hypothetical protein MIND_01090500 [Mycena indigotica]|uniref:Uncharacterized protein n=1 Tax=Mycena indigotica TaxID=2126181 RepID=A0A8H6S9L2_9AGAR|nr:uncharacterized protein MIND_01090500 [Mycena indigotica]KAF7295506.1 hypothetical protein MIND_01090500 [Mycena indigotica]